MTSATRDGSGRQAWIDYAKGIGIALVVLGHANRSIGRTSGLVWPESLQTLDHVIYSFHMPLFFALAGFASGLSRSRTWDGLKRGLVWGVIVPYVIWSVVWVGLKSAAPGATNNPIGLSALLDIWRTPIEHMWFLYHLLIARLLWFVIEKMRSDSFSKACVVLAAFLAFVLRYSDAQWDNLAGIAESCTAFGIGLLILPQILETFALDGAKTAAGLFAAFLLVLSLGSVSPSADALRPLAAILGAAAVIALSRSLPAPASPLLRWTAIAGEASMVIYVLHLLFGVAARIVLANTGLLSAANLLVTATLLGLAGPIAVYLFAMKANAATGLPLSRWAGFGTSTKSTYLVPATAPQPAH